MLATDLSEASSVATEHAFEVAEALAADLVILSVIDVSQQRAPGDLRVDQVRRTREAQVVEVVERARRRRIPTEFLIWTGNPADSIVEAAAAEGADMIVVGSHGRSGLGRAILGSVSDHVVRHAPCPVLVVRAVPDASDPARPPSGPWRRAV